MLEERPSARVVVAPAVPVAAPWPTTATKRVSINLPVLLVALVGLGLSVALAVEKAGEACLDSKNGGPCVGYVCATGCMLVYPAAVAHLARRHQTDPS